MHARTRRLGRDLDDDAVDDPGQPRDQLLAEDRVRPLRGHRRARGQLGQGRRQASSSPRSLRARGDAAGAGDGVQAARRTCRPRCIASLVCCASAARASAAAIDFDVPLLAGDHVTDDTGTGFVHTAPGHGREDFEIWTANAAKLAARGINTVIPYTVDENGAFTEQAPGFTGKRVLNDKGEKGDANEAVIKALADAGMLIARSRLKHQYPHSWRSKKPVIFRNTPQWFIAMDKPIIGASGACARRHAARPRARRHQGDALGAAAGREPHHRHDREPAGLGDLAPARLGRADRRVRAREGRRRGRHPADDARVNKRIADAFEQEGADAWYAAGRARALPRRARRTSALAEGRRHPRRLVRFRLDPRLRAGRRQAFPGPRRHQAQEGRRRRHRDVSRRLRPASRLVPVLAAGELRHARRRAVRRRADARLHARRGRPQDVEVARQHGGAAGRDQAVRRRHPADVGVRPATTADDQRIGPEILKTTVETYRKLRNTHALDARLARAFPRRRPRRRRTRCRSSSG